MKSIVAQEKEKVKDCAVGALSAAWRESPRDRVRAWKVLDLQQVDVTLLLGSSRLLSSYMFKIAGSLIHHFACPLPIPLNVINHPTIIQ